MTNPVIKLTVFVLLFVAGTGAVFSQNTSLPNYMTPAETLVMQNYLDKLSHSRLIPSPPPSPVRNMAEWEEVQALVIAWAGQVPILREIVRNAAKECKVLIVATDTTAVISSLTSANIPLDSVRFINTPFNTIWMCDYGPSCVYKNDVDSLWIVDWTYNRPRPQDDLVPVAIADYLDYTIYEATEEPYNWVHTGGNHLQTGTGTLFSSNLVLNENPDKTEEEIDTIAKLFLGINDYVKFPTLPYDGIHHLDMHMRVIDEETIVFGQYPKGIADGPQIEENIQYLLDSVQTAYGHPFNIIRIPMPPDANGRYPNNGGNYRTYTNAVFVNKTLLVPTYQEKYDTTALRIYRESLPGYNVVGINCNNIISQLGALHCITKLIGSSEPLLIQHARLRDVEDTVAFYPVSAYIRHRDGIKEASLFYRASTETEYTGVPMVLSDTTNNIWTALIPAFSAGTEVQYYISADANNGKHQVRPIVAPDGYFKFKVLGNPANQPPTVTILDPVDGSHFPFSLGHIPISYIGSDPDGATGITDLYINGEEVAFNETFTYTYDWSFPSPGVYFIEVVATDEDGATANSYVQITIEESTANKDLTGHHISYFPNPVTGQLTIDIDPSLQIKDVEVFDQIGRKLSLTQLINGSQFTIDFSSVATQVCVVRIKSDGKAYSFKIAKL